MQRLTTPFHMFVVNEYSTCVIVSCASRRRLLEHRCIRMSAYVPCLIRVLLILNFMQVRGILEKRTSVASLWCELERHAALYIANQVLCTACPGRPRVERPIHRVRRDCRWPWLSSCAGPRRLCKLTGGISCFFLLLANFYKSLGCEHGYVDIHFINLLSLKLLSRRHTLPVHSRKVRTP